MVCPVTELAKNFTQPHGIHKNCKRREMVLDAPALGAGRDDRVLMGEAVEERGGHLGATEDGRPFASGRQSGTPADQNEDRT